MTKTMLLCMSDSGNLEERKPLLSSVPSRPLMATFDSGVAAALILVVFFIDTGKANDDCGDKHNLPTKVEISYTPQLW